MRGAPNAMTGALIRDRRGDTDREATWRWRQRWKGWGHMSRAAWSPQKPEEAGRSLPWGLWREAALPLLDLRAPPGPQSPACTLEHC